MCFLVTLVTRFRNDFQGSVLVTQRRSSTADCSILWIGLNGVGAHDPGTAGLCGRGFRLRFTSRAPRRLLRDPACRPKAGIRRSVCGIGPRDPAQRETREQPPAAMWPAGGASVAGSNTCCIRRHEDLWAGYSPFCRGKHMNAVSTAMGRGKGTRRRSNRVSRPDDPRDIVGGYPTSARRASVIPSRSRSRGTWRRRLRRFVEMRCCLGVGEAVGTCGPASLNRVVRTPRRRSTSGERSALPARADSRDRTVRNVPEAAQARTPTQARRRDGLPSAPTVIPG